jgi:putative ABC transport system permease protein
MPLHDLRYALRLIIRRPAFSLIAIVTLAIGIGANTAIFTVFDRVVLRAVPFPDSGRLVVVWETNARLPVPVMVASPPTLHDWRTRNRVFEHIGAFRWRSVTISGQGDPEQVRAGVVTASLLRTLSVEPRMGRLFLDEEDRPKARGVALISDALWRRRFGASTGVLDQSVLVDGVPHQIVGVMPPHYYAPPPVVFRGRPPSDRAEIWIPLAIDLAGGQRGAHNLTVVARLRDGVSIAAADSDVKRIAAEVAHEHPDYQEWNARVVPLTGWVTESSRQSMSLLAVAVGFVFLLACANVANLLLARGVGRQREFAVRTALGAGRGRLAAQVVAESIALGVTGGIAGVALSAALVRIIVTFGPPTIPGLREAAIDVRALAFATTISLAAAVLASVVPAARLMRARVKNWLTERGAGAAPGAVHVQNALVVGQIALAMALLVSASLLVESFRQLRRVDPGFRPEHVMTAKLVVAATRYPNVEARVVLAERVLSDLRRVPGIAAVGVSDTVPLADNRQGTSFDRLDTPPSGDRGNTVNFAIVSDGFFEALGMRLLAGRTFTERDMLTSPRAVVINERLARQFFGNENAVGRLARLGISTQAPFEIVGVVADDRHIGIDADATPTFFASYRQFPNASAMREMAIIARGDGEAARTLAGVRAVVKAIDSQLPLFQVQTMEQVVNASVATPRSLAWLLSSFAVASLLLSAIGLFGVLSHAVTQRTKEIGVRIAVGATPGQVLRMVLAQAGSQMIVGMMLGVGLAFATSRILSGLLFGVTTATVMPYIVVALLLTVVTVIASLVPARRAMAVDPVTALRAD